MWDREEPYWGPGIQGSTIATSFSEAEMANWQERGCETSHPKPGSSKSQGSWLHQLLCGFPRNPTWIIMVINRLKLLIHTQGDRLEHGQELLNRSGA